MKDMKSIVLKLAFVNLLFFMSAYRVIFFIHFGKAIDLQKHFDKDIIFIIFCSESRITIEALEALFLILFLNQEFLYVFLSQN
jgi:hypothetical protein